MLDPRRGPLARSNRWSRCRPSWSCERNSALASGHQSATETSPSSPGSISVQLRDGSQSAGAGSRQLVHDGQAPVARDRRPRATRAAGRRGPARRPRRPSADRSRGGPRGSRRRAPRAGGTQRPVGRQAAAVVAAAPPGDRMCSVLRAISFAVAPASSLAYTTNPSRPLIEATSIPGTHAIPSFHPGSTPWSNTRSSPPSNGCTYQRRTRRPSRPATSRSRRRRAPTHPRSRRPGDP